MSKDLDIVEILRECDKADVNSMEGMAFCYSIGKALKGLEMYYDTQIVSKLMNVYFEARKPYDNYDTP